MTLTRLLKYVQDELSEGDGEVKFRGDRMVVSKGYVTLVVDSNGHETEIYNE